MNCMKCGKDIPDDQSFCDGCLQVMDAYPVKPDVAIQLPNRQPIVSAKPSHRKRALTPEEQIAQLKTVNRWLFGLCLVFALLWGICIGLLFYRNALPKFAPTGVTSATYAESSVYDC